MIIKKNFKENLNNIFNNIISLFRANLAIAHIFFCHKFNSYIISYYIF